MSSESIRQSLTALRAEIEALGDQEIDQRRRLERIVAEIEAELDEVEHPDGRASLVGKVQAGIETFEVEHPRATAILNEILVVLGNMGI